MKRLDTIIKKKTLTKRGMRWYFTRHAPNGEKLERSQMYKQRQGRNKRIRKILESEIVNVE
jgi:hypothetical protein